jgi:hypothetical protein
VFIQLLVKVFNRRLAPSIQTGCVELVGADSD